MTFKYSKSQVNAAGLVIRDHHSLSDPGMDEALNALGEWRSCQAYPLQVAYMKLRERAKRADSKATASQRLKRIPSIITKLRRNQNMKLSTVQDIGGCRAVVQSIAHVKKLAAQYGTPARDYIANPKPDGYRSIHFVDPYAASDPKYAMLDGRRTEVQIRTRLQHAWATAVETVDSIMGQKLKTGGGHADWKRFFSLSSGYFAHLEKSACVPGTPESIDDLKSELRELTNKLKVFNKLDGMASSVEVLKTIGTTGPRIGRNRIVEYIFVLDVEKRVIDPIGFTEANLAFISDEYLRLEKRHFDNPNIQVVQVKVGTARDLKKAYPNYYLDAQSFLASIKAAIKVSG